MNYYNENDPKAAAWLRELIKGGHISEGVVDERSIIDVLPTDLHGYQQCHFFAGIGGWSYALQLAGVPDDEPVWTGSCPCQPFSQGGFRRGNNDERHLWPVFSDLIKKCRPATVFGEQVDKAIGFGWLDLVCSDLEAQGYAMGAAVLGAHSKDLPHVRQRLFWVADSECDLDDRSTVPQRGWQNHTPSIWEIEQIQQKGQDGINELESRHFAQRVSSYPEALSLLNGIPGRMDLMRGAGNAIIPQVAADFIKAFYEARSDVRSDVLMSDPAF